MKRLRHNNFLTVVLLIAFLGGCSGVFSSKSIKTEMGTALGTTYTIKYEAVSGDFQLKKEIEAIVSTINNSMSTYLPDSDISKINRGDSTVVVDTHFKTVFFKAKEVWKNSRGAFDPTVGALVNAWGFGPEGPLKTMTQKQVDSLLEFTGFNKVMLSEEGKIVKEHPSLYLDFNALAKGYVIDLIAEMLVEKGIENYLIELGGEILAGGINTRSMKPWQIAIDDPLQKERKRTFIARLGLKDKALATSGNYRKFRIDEETGERYVHIINPETGYPQKSRVLSVSVIAPTCMEADAYATTFMIMEPEAVKTLLEGLPAIEAYSIGTDENGRLTTHTIQGFEELTVNDR